MDLTTSTIVFSVLIPSLVALGGYALRNLLARIDQMETRLQKTVDENTVRQLIGDKLDPLREDLQEIKASINKLFDLYVQNNRK